MTPAAGERDHMVQGGVVQSEGGSAVDTPSSTIPKGLALDLALVLLVEQAASVTGYPAGGTGENDMVDDPT
jgi:hypothetical protein